MADVLVQIRGLSPTAGKGTKAGVQRGLLSGRGLGVSSSNASQGGCVWVK